MKSNLAPIAAFMLVVLTDVSLPSRAAGQESSRDRLAPIATTNIPEHPAVTVDKLRVLGVNETEAGKNSSRSAIDYHGLFPVGYGVGGGFNQGYALAHAGMLQGTSMLAGMNPCYVNASACGQYGHLTSASALQYFEAESNAVNYSLSLLNSLMPGGNHNQFFGQYAPPGGGRSSGMGGQVYADAVFNQTYSPHIQALLGYDPNASYNFTTQFLNYTGSLFIPTADWNSSFSLFPSFGWGAGKGSAQDDLPGRYAALGQQQLADHFTNPSLSDLRKEERFVMTDVLMTDPYYVYYRYFLNDAVTQLYTTRPSYAAYVSLRNEIASWTEPHQHQAVLEERYFKRYLLTYYEALVQYEVAAHLYRSSLPRDQSREGRTGTSRRRVDILIEQAVRPRLVYVFEAKRLRRTTHPLSKYLGTDGLGCFLRGSYASNSPEGAMVGYVQTPTVGDWASELQEAFNGPERSKLDVISGLDPQQLLPGLPYAWVSVHSRSTGSNITIIHILLDCCIPSGRTDESSWGRRP